MSMRRKCTVCWRSATSQDKDGGLNAGNGVTDYVKLQTKQNRLQGVHVTPTVVFDGVVNNDISSMLDGEAVGGVAGEECCVTGWRREIKIMIDNVITTASKLGQKY